MATTTLSRTRRTACSWRKSWVLAYQDAAGTPDDELLERAFRSEAAALAWADASFVVPLWLEEREQLIGDNGRVLGTIVERHEI